MWESEQLFVLNRSYEPGAVWQDEWVGTTRYEAIRDALPRALHSYYHPPVVQNGTIYFTANIRHGFLYAVDAVSGGVKWKLAVSETDFSPLTIVGDQLYVAAGKVLHAINVKTQREVWKYEASAVIPDLMPPLVENGVVYFGSEDGNLYAVHAANGKEKWVFKNGSPVHWKPLVFHNDTLYAAESEGTIRALKVNPPQEQWKVRPFKGLWRIALADDALYAVGLDGMIRMLDARDGKVMPEFRKGNRLWTEPAFYDGKIYYSGFETGSIFAVDAQTGKQVWKFSLGYGCRPPTIAGEMVFATCLDRKIYGLDAKTGKKLWDVDAPHRSMSEPVVADGALYFIADDGKIHAIK